MEGEPKTEVNDELMKYEHFDQEGIVDKYKDLAEKYDEMLEEVVGYPDPVKICEALLKVGIPKDAPICDFGCGTGLMGKYASDTELFAKVSSESLDAPFSNITGIDASPEMLEKAQSRGYTKLSEVFLGAGQFPADLEGKFDVAVSSGVLAHGHVSAELFDEKLRCLRKSEADDDKRYIIFTTREEYLDTLGYGEKLKQLEDEGKIKYEDKLTFTRYQNTADKEVSRFKPVEVSCFIYKANV